jgi:hypothetical protein
MSTIPQTKARKPFCRKNKPGIQGEMALVIIGNRGEDRKANQNPMQTQAITKYP